MKVLWPLFMCRMHIIGACYKSTMSDRRQELERKKQKLALIREEKEKRRREKAKEVYI